LGFTLIIIGLFLFLSHFSKAASAPEIIINEIAWMGTQVEGIESKNWWRYEWLELYNNTEKVISLNNWKIELYRDEFDWSLNLNGAINPNDYFLIVSSDKISPNYDLNYSNLGGKFNNSGQKVILKDELGNIIDSLDCFSYGKWFAGDNSTKQTMERIDSLLILNINNWQTSQNPGGTPKIINSVAETEPKILISTPTPNPTTTPTPDISPISNPISESSSSPSPLISPIISPTSTTSPIPKNITYPSGIIINEILPAPIGSDEQEEWIEISNQNNFEVDISFWQISDTSGKITKYTIPEGTKIAGQGFLIFGRPTTGIVLNNDEDGLRIIQPDGKIADEITYQKATNGKSYNQTKTGWAWSSDLTPNSLNKISIAIQETAGNKNISKSQDAEKEVAAIVKKIPEKSSSALSFSIAISLAIFSGFAILFLKNKI